jgi:hypothetical protein
MEREEPNDENEYIAKALLNKKIDILIAKGITVVEIEEIKENIKLKIRDGTEDHSKIVNGDKMDKTVTENQRRDQESNNASYDKVENNKQTSPEEQQNTVRNKLNEGLYIMWHKVRLL